MSPYALVAELEHRPDRAYDEQDASHLIHPNGTLIASFSRSFLNVAGRLIVELWRAAA